MRLLNNFTLICFSQKETETQKYKVNFTKFPKLQRYFVLVLNSDLWNTLVYISMISF